MKRILTAVFFLLCGLTQSLTAVDSVTVSTGPQEKKLKVLILPPDNLADKKKYNNTELVSSIFFRSFYTFIGIIPTLDVPQESILTNLNRSKEYLVKTADEQSADMVLFGNYTFSGDKFDPKVKAEMNIWSRQSNAVIFTKVYNTSTGPDIFDTIDEMITTSVKNAFNIDVNVATVQFSDFLTGNEAYSLFVNDKLISRVTNDGFSYNLKVLPDTVYKVNLLRDWDKKDALQASIKLKKYDNINVTYKALGGFRIQDVGDADRTKKYTVRMNGETVTPGQIISNLPAGKNYNFTVVDSLSNTVMNKDIYLHDGATNDVTPTEKSAGMLHFRAYSVDGSMLTLGADLFLGRYFWVGLGAGLSYWPFENAAPFVFISPQAELGYYFWGDMSYDIRIGAGINAKYNTVAPIEAAKKLDSTIPDMTLSAGVFVQGEWKFIMFRPAFYVNMNGTNMSLSFGLGTGLHF